MVDEPEEVDDELEDIEFEEVDEFEETDTDASDAGKDAGNSGDGEVGLDEQLAAGNRHRDRTEEICSVLIANGYVHKDEFRDLLFDEHLREAVGMRLDRVGLKLLHNAYSNYWGIGLNEATTADTRLEWSNNFGLDRGAMALMLIIWCKLVLPKRLAQETRQPDDGTVAPLFPEIEKVPDPKVSVSRDQLVAEFGDLLGGITMTGRYLTQLSRGKLIKLHGGVIAEGPMLALVIDEARLSDELRREVLLNVLRREQAVAETAASLAQADLIDDDISNLDDL